MKEHFDKELILNQIKKQYNLKTDTALADFLGLKANTIATWRTRNTIDYERIISKCDEIDANWLFTGKGSMLKKAENSVLQTKTGTPLVSAEALGGIANAVFSIEEKDIQARYVVPDFENVDFMMRVTGRSMEPNYNSGDVVACRIIRERSFIQWNRVHIITTADQGILIKRLKKGEKGKTITAVSDNQEYDPFEVPLKEITGIALVVGVIRLE